VFDGLVNVMVQELKKGPMRPHLCDKKSRRIVIDQVVDQIKELCDQQDLILHDFSEIPERIRMMNLKLHKKDLPSKFVDL